MTEEQRVLIWAAWIGAAGAIAGGILGGLAALFAVKLTEGVHAKREVLMINLGRCQSVYSRICEAHALLVAADIMLVQESEVKDANGGEPTEPFLAKLRDTVLKASAIIEELDGRKDLYDTQIVPDQQALLQSVLVLGRPLVFWERIGALLQTQKSKLDSEKTKNVEKEEDILLNIYKKPWWKVKTSKEQWKKAVLGREGN